MNLEDKYQMLASLLSTQYSRDFITYHHKKEIAHRLDNFFPKEINLMSLVSRPMENEEIPQEYLDTFEYDDLEDYLKFISAEYISQNKATHESYSKNFDELMSLIEEIGEDTE